MNNFSDYKIDARLRLFGDIDDRSLVEGHDRMAAEATVGPDQRWVLYDPANEALPEDHPILLIRPYNVEDAVRLRYEVRGWSHLKAAPGTLLDEGDFKIDLRLSLIIHFYANGRIPSTSVKELLQKDLREYMSAAVDAIKGVGLAVRYAVLRVTIEETEYLRALREFIDSLHVTCAQLGAKKSVLQTVMNDVDAIVIIATDTDEPTDDIFWYKYWQSCQAYRHLVNYASQLTEQSRQTLTDAVNFDPKIVRKKDAIKNCLDLRSQLLRIQDHFRTFSLMADTVRTFRRHLVVGDHLQLGVPPTGFTTTSLREWQAEEEARLYEMPLDRVEAVIQTLMDAAQARLESLDSLQQASFNYSVQRRLTMLQWMLLVVALVTLLVAIATLRSSQQTSPSLSPTPTPTIYPTGSHK